MVKLVERRTRTSQIGFRLPAKDAAQVRDVCKRRGEDVSDFVRRAIRKELASLDFLKPADLQALGLKPSPSKTRHEEAEGE